MMTHLLICGLLAAMAGGATPADDEPTPAAEGPTWERYEILVERNIFSRERGRPDPVVRREQPAAPPPERFLLLTGVVKQGEEWTAFLEDARTGSIKKLHVGDPVLGGRVAAITMDSIDYEKDGGVARVAMGGNLEGGSSTRSSGPATSSTTSAPTRAAEPSDILERLRQRRQRELGQ
jgi:hypothetical protein